MCKILLPVDGSDASCRAVQLVIRLDAKMAPLKAVLLHVEVPLVPVLGDSTSPESSGAPAETALVPAKALLDAAVVPYTSEIVRGYTGSMIAAYAKEHECDAIIMGTRGMGSTEQVLGSIARQVIQFADVPVTLVK